MADVMLRHTTQDHERACTSGRAILESIHVREAIEDDIQPDRGKIADAEHMPKAAQQITVKGGHGESIPRVGSTEIRSVNFQRAGLQANHRYGSSDVSFHLISKREQPRLVGFSAPAYRPASCRGRDVR